MPKNTLLEEETLNFWDSFIVSAKVTIDGVEKDYPIFKTIKDGHIMKKFVYLQSEAGLVTHGRLIDRIGREIRSKDMHIQKGGDGLMITFFLGVRIEEGIQ